MNEKKSVKVLEVFDSLEISGGVQAVVMNVFRVIDHDIVQMDFAVYQNPKENSYHDEIEQHGGKVIPVNNPGSCGLIGFYRQFCNIFENEHYDAVHAHNIHHNGLILLAAKKAGIPIRISHSHQACDERNTSLPRRLIASILKLINNRVATRRVACSDFAGKFLYGKKSFEFLPNAINLDKFNIEESKETLRKNYNLPREKIILIHVGHFYYPKNQFFLIDIMKNLKDFNCILLMAGNGPLFDEFNIKVKESNLEDKIICLGLRNDIPQLLLLSDCMLLPSIYEGLPVVAIEAQAEGCYCLISDSVTKQSDLGLGLVEFLPINNSEMWASLIRKHDYKSVVTSRKMVQEKMKELKFDANSNLLSWYELYGVS